MYGRPVFVAYLDESGDEQSLRTANDPPVLVIASVSVAHAQLQAFTWDFVTIKKRFADSDLSACPLSDLLRYEIKGSDLRADIRRGSRRRSRRAIGILDAVLSLLDQHHATVSAEILVKPDASPVHHFSYSEAVARLADHFEAQLAAAQTEGVMILDARTKNKNFPSVARITTKRFKTGGNRYPHLVESPVFGHSDSHVPLQVADIVASALLFPMACAAYCDDLVGNAHPHPAYAQLRPRYGERIRSLEYRYLDASGLRRGGVRVLDRRNSRRTRDLLVDPSGASATSGGLVIQRTTVATTTTVVKRTS